MGGSSANQSGPDQHSTWGAFIGPLRDRQEYVLILGFLFALTLVSLALRGPWLFGALLSVVALAAFAFFLVYRTSRAQTSEAAAVAARRQAERSVEALRDLERKREAVRGVFEDLVRNDMDSYFVYSSHPAGPPFDIYLNDPIEVEDPAKFETEIVWPVT